MIKPRRMRLAGRVVCMEEECIRVFSRKSEGKTPLGRLRYEWKIIIPMAVREILVSCGIWTAFMWFRIGTSGKLSETQ
jgi:hypothetical protein